MVYHSEKFTPREINPLFAIDNKAGLPHIAILGYTEIYVAS